MESRFAGSYPAPSTGNVRLVKVITTRQKVLHDWSLINLLSHPGIPWCTGFKHCLCHQPQSFVLRITSKWLNRFISFLTGLMALTYRLSDYILVNFGRDLDLELSQVKYGICCIWTKIEEWSDCHETKNKHIDWTLGLKCDHRVWPWPWPWPWIFKVKYRICSISDERKSTHIDWTLCLKCDLRVWPWPWPWPWNFKVKYGTCYISAKNGLIDTKRNLANILIEL